MSPVVFATIGHSEMASFILFVIERLVIYHFGFISSNMRGLCEDYLDWHFMPNVCFEERVNLLYMEIWSICLLLTLFADFRF